MSIFGLPLILFQIPSGAVFADDEMSDFQFLAIKAFLNKLVDNTVIITTTGVPIDLAALTAAGGKDLYLAKAKVKMSTGSSSALNATIAILVNGVEKDRVALKIDGSPVSNDKHEFILSGVKVTTGQVIKLRAISNDSAIVISSTITGWEEDTNATPQEPPLNPV